MSAEGLRQDLDALFTRLKMAARALASAPDVDSGTSAEAARLVREIRDLKIRAWHREGRGDTAHLEAAVTITATARGNLPEDWTAGRLAESLQRSIDIYVDDINDCFVEDLEENYGEPSPVSTLKVAVARQAP